MALIEYDGYELEEGYRLEKVTGGLTFPSNIEFDPSGALYIVEAGFTYPFLHAPARISRLAGDGREPIAEGFHGPMIGLRWHDGGFLATHRGTLTRVELNGAKRDLVTDIPSYGDHHTNHIVVRDAKVYFGQGTVTNSGVVGPDNLLLFGWLVAHRDGHDTPPFDITLTGTNFTARDPFNPLRHVDTGAFLPFGHASAAGQVVRGELKANGVIFRCNPDGSELEVYAWGLRNPYALRAAPDGRLLTIVQGEDMRGSRPMHAPDALCEVKQGAWYGWPDFSGGNPVSAWMPEDSDAPTAPVMRDHPALEPPLYLFEAHCAAVSMDFSDSDAFGFRGEAFIAEWGAEQPFTTGGKMIFRGQKLVRLDLNSLQKSDFYRKRPGENLFAPNRPVMARFSPDGSALYLLDHGLRAIPKSGALWKITRT
jgi:glucose/arabinose dehydrogenase